MKNLKKKWDELSEQNAKYFIYSDNGKNISDEEFQRSGKKDFETLIERDQLLMKFLTPTETKTAVEIGCGTGRITEFLAQKFNHVYGFDISQRMIDEGRTRLKNITNVTLQNTDGEHIPLEESSVDFVFSYIVFQHMPSATVVENNFKEIYRILKSGGIAKIQVRGLPTKKGKWFSGVSFTEESIEKTIGNLTLLQSEGAGRKYFWLWLTKT